MSARPTWKRAGPSRKNWRFSGKNRLKRVEVDLLRIRLDLREIRSIAGVQQHRRRDTPLQVHAPVTLAAPAWRDRRSVVEPRGRERCDPEVVAAGDLIDAGQDSREAHRVVVELTRHRGPQREFVLPVDDAQHVEAPLLRAGVGEAKRLERDGELEAPPILANRRVGEPDTVPVGIVAPVVERLHVATGAARTDPETVAGALVEERINEDHEGIAEETVEVARQLVDDQALRFGVVQHAAHVQHLVVVEEPDLASLCRGGELVWKLLEEIDRRFSELPGRLVRHTVDRNRFGHADGLETLRGADGFEVESPEPPRGRPHTGRAGARQPAPRGHTSFDCRTRKDPRRNCRSSRRT